MEPTFFYAVLEKTLSWERRYSLNEGSVFFLMAYEGAYDNMQILCINIIKARKHTKLCCPLPCIKGHPEDLNVGSYGLPPSCLPACLYTSISLCSLPTFFYSFFHFLTPFSLFLSFFPLCLSFYPLSFYLLFSILSLFFFPHFIPL